MKLIEVELLKFTRKAIVSKLKFKRSIMQTEEVISHYKNTEHQEILAMINTVISSQLSYSNEFSLHFTAWILFSLEGSRNSFFFKGIIQKLYSIFNGCDLVGLAEEYVLFDKKSQKLTSVMMSKFWLMSNSFNTVGKIIAHTDLVYFQNYTDAKMTEHVRLLIQSIKKTIKVHSFLLRSKMSNSFHWGNSLLSLDSAGAISRTSVPLPISSLS